MFYVEYMKVDIDLVHIICLYMLLIQYKHNYIIIAITSCEGCRFMINIFVGFW